jgi:Transglutaminase-like superfamily
VAQPTERGCVPGAADLHSERMRQALEPSARDPIVARMPVGRRLNPAERARLIVEILASYREARRALRSMQIELAVERLRGGARADADRGTDSEVLYEAWRLGRAVQLTLRLAPGDTRCLTRSLVLTQMLARRSIPATLVIGTRAKPRFSAHAWVEQTGQPVLPAGEHSLGRLVEL